MPNPLWMIVSSGLQVEAERVLLTRSHGCALVTHATPDPSGQPPGVTDASAAAAV
jgi:hypothetical protein